MVIPLLAAAAVVIFFVLRRRRLRREAPKLWEGVQTGVHSPYAVPGGRFFRNRRTL